jgi:hypothetical protein
MIEGGASTVIDKFIKDSAKTQGKTQASRPILTSGILKNKEFDGSAREESFNQTLPGSKKKLTFIKDSKKIDEFLVVK